MRNIYLILIGLLVLTVNCSEEFTDVDPIGSLNDAQLANPTGVELLTIFDVDPSDISKLIPDTSVKIQLNALPAQKHGELKGKLIYVSADTVDEDVDGNSGNFYRARAQITENELKDTPPGFNLMPGMKVSGKFRVGKRKLITYFIYPLIRTLGNSFAEP